MTIPARTRAKKAKRKATTRAKSTNRRKSAAAAPSFTEETLVHMLSVSLQKALVPVHEQLRKLSGAMEQLEARVDALGPAAPAAPPRAPAGRPHETRAGQPTPSNSEEPGCLVPECQAAVLAKQLCETHYRIMRRTAANGEEFDPNAQRPARARVASRSCEEPDCTDPHYAKGLCRRHYMATRSRIRAAERQETPPAKPAHPAPSAPTPAAAITQVSRAFTDDNVHPHTPSNGGRTATMGSRLFNEPVASTASSREALPTAEVVSRVVTQYRGGLDRVAEVLGRNKRTLMELLDRLDLMPFVTRIREAERQRIESATLRERLDDLLFREKLLDDLGCLKDVDERARFEVKSRCADLAKNSETMEEALHRLARDLDLDDAGMKRLVWRYDLRRYLRGLKLKSESAPVRSR